MQLEITPTAVPVQREIISVWNHEVDFSFSEKRETVKVKAERGTIHQILGDQHFALQDVQFQAMGAENGFSPFLFKHGYRRIENAKTASLLVLDYDELKAIEEQALFAALDHSGLAFVAHTTKSHSQYKPKKDSFFRCWRIVLPSETPMSAPDYVATLNDLLSKLPPECKVDPMVRVVSQRWTFPCARASSIARGDARFIAKDGHLLPVVKAPLLSLVPVVSTPSCTLNELKAKLANVHSSAPDIGAATHSILNGHALPFEEGRQQILWLRTVTSIARITSCDATQLLELVTPSINAGIIQGSHVTLKSVGYQIRRALESVRSSPSTFIPMEARAQGTVKGAMVEARVRRFIQERLVMITTTTTTKTSGQRLYDAYIAWTEGKGLPTSQVIFAKVMKESGCTATHTRTGNLYAVEMR